MTRLLAVCLGLWAGAAGAQDCAALHAAALDLARSTRLEVVSAGDLNEVDGQCRLSGMVLERAGPGGLHFSVGEVIWTAEGLDPSGNLGARAALDLEVRDLVWHPRTGIDALDYSLAVQARRRGVHAALVADWDPAAARLRISTFRLDLPGPNAVSLRLTLSGLHPGIAVMRGVPQMPVTLDALQLTIRNEGYFDALYLPRLAAALSDGRDGAEARMERVKRDLREVVGDLPDAAFGADSKAALLALIDAAPAPWGTLRVTQASGTPYELQRLAHLATRTMATPEDLAAAFEGVAFRVRFDPWEGWAD